MSSIVSPRVVRDINPHGLYKSHAPIIQIDPHKFQAKAPTILSDREAWLAYLDAQQMILKCTQFTVALKKSLQKNADLQSLDARLVMLDEEISAILARYSWSPHGPSSELVDSEEHALAKSLKSQAQIKLNSARIKLHRYRAFRNVPIFTRRHCDLERVTETATTQLACCSSMQQSPQSASDSIARSLSPSSSSFNTGLLTPEEVPCRDDLFSARMCMRAALSLSRAFDALPYPNPTGTDSTSLPTFLSSRSCTPAPRTMPAFACCSMQGSYALLMLCRKSQERNKNAPSDPASLLGLEELRVALQRILGALQNYSLAYEALGGMRGRDSMFIERQRSRLTVVTRPDRRSHRCAPDVLDTSRG